MKFLRNFRRIDGEGGSLLLEEKVAEAAQSGAKADEVET